MVKGVADHDHELVLKRDGLIKPAANLFSCCHLAILPVACFEYSLLKFK